MVKKISGQVGGALSCLLVTACIVTAYAKPAVEPPKPTGTRVSQSVAPEHATRTWPVRKLADSGQKSDTTPVFGEDSDYVRNPQSYKDNGDGTVTDNVTGLMWTKADAGEKTWEAYVAYCDQLSLGRI